MYTAAVVALFSALSYASPISRMAKRADPSPLGETNATDAQLRTLRSSSTNGQRLLELVPDFSNPVNLTYQFSNLTVDAPTGGIVDLASLVEFPALALTNVAMALGFLNPCSLNTPHSHPRGNEFLTVMQGELTTGFIPEVNPNSLGNVHGEYYDPGELSGPLPQINANLGLYQGTIFPQGLVHFEFNPTCEPAVFVNAFDNSDPGRVEIARSFMSMDTELVQVTLGLYSSSVSPSMIDSVRSSMPAAFVSIIDSCAAKCGISTGRNDTTTSTK